MRNTLRWLFLCFFTISTSPAQTWLRGSVDFSKEPATGGHEWQPNQRTILVEFAGGALEHWPRETPPEPVVEILGNQASRVRVLSPLVQPLADGRWRLAFQIEPTEEGATLESIGPLELRATLRAGEDFPAETWAYRLEL